MKPKSEKDIKLLFSFTEENLNEQLIVEEISNLIFNEIKKGKEEKRKMQEKKKSLNTNTAEKQNEN